MTVKNTEKLEKSRVALTIEVGAEEFEAAVAKAYLKARKQIRVPGFRPGKAPRKMIEKMYGASVFYSDAVDIALPDAYTKAVGDSGLDIIGYPEVEIVGEVTADGLQGIRDEYAKLVKDKAYLESIMKSGAEKASHLAAYTLRKVYKKVGFYSC